MNEADDVNTTLISAFHILIHIVHSVIKILRWTTEDANIFLRPVYKDSAPKGRVCPKMSFV